MDEQEYFVSQFGEKIKIIPGYAQKMGNTKKLNELYKDLTYTPGMSVKINVNNFGKDLITYALLTELLDSVGLLPEQGYERALDIGGQEGIHAALFRAHYAKHITVTDLMDGRDPELTNKMKQIIRNSKKHKYLEILYRRNKLTAPILQKLFPNMQMRRLMSMCQTFPSFEHYFNFNFKRELAVDEFIVGDFFEKTYGQYDIAVSFLTPCIMDYFKFIKKVSDLLPKGGVFAFITRYQWGPGSLLRMPADIPYFEKRLTLEDMERYYMKYQPDQVAYTRKVFNIFDPNRTSIQQYIKQGYDNNLHLVAMKPLIVPFLSDTINSHTNKDEWSREIDAKEVLRDIKHFRSDIGMQDLFVSYNMMVFKKV